jgi:hypothetical protein
MNTKGHDQPDGCCQEDDRLGRGPAGLGGPGQRIDEQHQASGYGRRPSEVEPSLGQLRTTLREEQGREPDHERANRNVDEEDPLPAERVGQHATEQQSERAPSRRRRGPNAEGPVALATLRKDGHEHRERRRHEQRRAQTLDRPAHDQRGVVPRQAVEQRSDGEHRHAGDEQTPPTEEIGQPPAEQKHPSEEDRVRRHHPLQVLLREAEIRLDRRQRDVDDRGVEDGHELRHHEDGEGPPAAGVGLLNHLVGHARSESAKRRER